MPMILLGYFNWAFHYHDSLERKRKKLAFSQLKKISNMFSSYFLGNLILEKDPAVKPFYETMFPAFQFTLFFYSVQFGQNQRFPLWSVLLALQGLCLAPIPPLISTWKTAVQKHKLSWNTYPSLTFTSRILLHPHMQGFQDLKMNTLLSWSEIAWIWD